MNDKITPEPQAIEGVRISGQIDEVGRLFEEESSSTSLTSIQRPLQDNDNNLKMPAYIPPLFPAPQLMNQAQSHFSSFQHMIIPDTSAATSFAAVKHSTGLSKATPDFVRKLYNIIEDEENRETIRWNNDFDSIIILNPALFSSVVLPLHFKHCKFASFVRQLNKHNFHRVKLPPDNEYGEHACAYKHPMFQKDRHDLLEKIFRQQSKMGASSTTSSLFPIETSKDTNEQNSNSTLSIDRLSQGQKETLYQIKELERRGDLFERELANCFYVVELQARLIRDLLCILPSEVRNHPEILSLMNDLKWNSSSKSLGKFGQMPNSQTNLATPMGFDSLSPQNNISSNLHVQQQQLTQKQQSINQQQQQLNEQQQQLNSHISCQQQFSKGSDWWIKPMNQQKTSNGMILQTNPFHNDQNQMIGSPWNRSDIYSAESSNPLAYLPSTTNLPHFRAPDTIQSLSILIFVGSTREQRIISDIFLELSCLSFKFAVDISHVFNCLDDKSEAYHVVILDQVHESYSLISRLRQFNSQLVVIFASQIQQDPTPPPSEKIERILSLPRPVTLLGMRHCLTKCLEYYQS